MFRSVSSAPRLRSQSICRAVAVALAGTMITAALAGCGKSEDSKASATTDSGGAKAEAPTTVRLGYFPNLTHAPALIGVQNGLFKKALGQNKLEAQIFKAGPEAVEALFADALDITYIGPNPAINAYSKSNGEAVRVVSGSTSGGAALVTREGLNSAVDLKGKKIASPQLGNTQDVALRSWLESTGLKTDSSGGGDVSIEPQENADALAAFVAGKIDGAWIPEPWVTRFVQEGKGHILVDEGTLWPDGKYVTTHIIVRTKFLDEHPSAVKAVLAAHLEALDLITSDPTAAKTAANAALKAAAGKSLKDEVLNDAWKRLTFTADPVASSLAKSAEDGVKVGLTKPVSNLAGIYALDTINELLKARGEAAVSGIDS